MNRRVCGDVTKDECNDDKPPLVDYPRYSSSLTSYSDLLHYDIKIPAEHELNGDIFDAEVQMLTLHPADGRIASIGILVRAQDDGYNSDFQPILDAFVKTFDQHADQCQEQQLQQQRRAQEEDMEEMTSSDVTPISNDTAVTALSSAQRRYLRAWDDSDMTSDNHDDSSARNVKQLSLFRGFDPFVDALWPSIFFYRYDGTLTEPPCTAITWFVMEKPIIIGTEQLEQMKRVLFTHRDGNCRQTSVHNVDQSVARPVFRGNDETEIQGCTDGSFQADIDKGRLPGRKCKV
jgi:carbonic anhydrase